MAQPRDQNKDTKAFLRRAQLFIYHSSICVHCSAARLPSSVHRSISSARHVARWTRCFLPRCVSRSGHVHDVYERLLHVGNIGPSAPQLGCLVTARVSECLPTVLARASLNITLSSSAQQLHHRHTDVLELHCVAKQTNSKKSGQISTSYRTEKGHFVFT